MLSVWDEVLAENASDAEAERLRESVEAVREVACDLCRTLTLPDVLEDVTELCAGGNERRACPQCVTDLEQERRAEWALEDSHARHVDSDETLGLQR